MDDTSRLNINSLGRFPHLSHSPVTEAVFEFRGQARKAWTDTEVLSRLQEQLAEFLGHKPAHPMNMEVDSGSEPPPASRDINRQGLVFTSLDGLRIARFHRDSFSFSRLAPYPGWDEFISEAFNIWMIYYDLSAPHQVDRLGLRFINAFPSPQPEMKLSETFKSFEEGLPDPHLVLSGFLRHDVYSVPGLPYGINVITTAEPQSPDRPPELILDIDVFTQWAFEMNRALLMQKLEYMRWLKNKVFFGSITSEVRERLKK